MIADLLGRLHQARSPRIVLVLRPQDQIPTWVDNVIQMESSISQSPKYIGPKRDLRQASAEGGVTDRPSGKRAAKDSPEVFTLTDANVKYQDRHILKNITWAMKAGDRAVLTGPNGMLSLLPLESWPNQCAFLSVGSGKSTLLSLILGDHPASYTQELSLFTQPRSKHSTYSLAQKIGHYSPELFASFPRKYGEAGLSLYEVIGTGFENVFTYRKLSDEQKGQIDLLLAKFDPNKQVLTSKVLHDTLFVEAEPALQALSLILRATVKRPALLVLDEPFAGMTPELVQQCRHFIDNCLDDNQTLIFISHYQEEWPSSIGTRMHLEEGRGMHTSI